MSTIGRIGALAVAFGVGGMFGQCALAGADDGAADSAAHPRNKHTTGVPKASVDRTSAVTSSPSAVSEATFPSTKKSAIHSVAIHSVASSARASKSTTTPLAPGVPSDTLSAAALAAARRADRTAVTVAPAALVASLGADRVYYDEIVTNDAWYDGNLTGLNLNKVDYTLRDSVLQNIVVDIQAKDESGNYLELTTYTVHDEFEVGFYLGADASRTIVRAQNEVDVWVLQIPFTFDVGCETDNSCNQITAASKMLPGDKLLCDTNSCDPIIGDKWHPWFAVKKGLWDDALANVPPIGGDRGDAEAPTPPTITATDVTATTVTLLPSGSTDNVKVVGYDIYRDGRLLTFDGLAAGESFVDSVDPGGSYTYYATAYDAARNYSEDGLAITVTPATGESTNPGGGGGPTNPGGGGGSTNPGGGGGSTNPGNGLEPLPPGMEPIGDDIPTYIAEAIKRIAKPLPKILRQPVADAIEAIYRLCEAIPFLGTAVSVVDVAWGMGEIANAVTAHDKEWLKSARYDVIWSVISFTPGVGTVNGLVEQTADVFNLGWISTGKEWSIHRAIDAASLTHRPDLVYQIIRNVDAYIDALEEKEGWSSD